MKTKIIAVALAAAIALSGCGRPQYITTPDNITKEYPTYGFFNESTAKSNQVCYEPSIGNIILSVIFVASVVVPVYFVGFSLFNPVGPKGPNGCGIDSK